MIEYKLIRGSTFADFELWVNQAISLGYELVGGPFQSSSGMLCQAMVIVSDDKE